jgi:hypothetical protein
MRAAKKIRHRLEWRKFATKIVPLLSRKPSIFAGATA